MHAAAARETAEEALAQVEVGSLLCVVNVLRAAQVHVMFLRPQACCERRTSAPASESSGEVAPAYISEAQIPWADIAFASIRFALERYFLDRREHLERIHFHDIVKPLPR